MLGQIKTVFNGRNKVFKVSLGATYQVRFIFNDSNIRYFAVDEEENPDDSE